MAGSPVDEKVADKWRDATFEFIERQARICFRYDKKRLSPEFLRASFDLPARDPGPALFAA
jgi:hypothetical protein